MIRPAACSTRQAEADYEVDQFMNALAAQESGNPNAVNRDTGAAGAWQILPSNWPRWAKEAGLASDAPNSVENQRLVTRHKLTQYFAAFGSWARVAKAWYAGAANNNVNSNRPQGRYPSINAYAASVMSKVGALPCQ